jgi:16S rRNA (guanine966-N2)-methyltransferase
VRVVAGKWRGRTIHAPRGTSVRPTTDRVREAVFSILGDGVQGSVVLDLFAGTGAMAIESLSRGAAAAVLVESSAAALNALRANLAALEAEEAVCLPLDYREAVRRLSAKGRTFDLVFLDPPYGEGLVGRAAGLLSRAGILAPGAVVVAERAARDTGDTLPVEWMERSDRRYGDTRITLYDIPGPRGQAPPGGKKQEKQEKR